MTHDSASHPAPPPLPATVRVYVNERPVDVARAAPVRAAIAAFDPAQGERLAAGAVQVTDSRGLPLDPDTPAHGGAIYRLIPVRTRGAAAGADVGPAGAAGAADPDPTA